MLLKHPVTEGDARSNPARKANQPVHCLPLEKALVRWIERCEQLNMPVVTWATIRTKAEKIRRALVRDAEHASNTKLRNMVFSDGWIQKLQERHNQKPRRVHEAASARVIDVEEGRVALQLIASKYRHRDIFNMDESAYFYCTTSPTSVSRSSVAGRKKIKERLTVAVTTNANGSFKVSLLFVGTARKPRCFGTHTAAELGFDYTNAAKGWMTTQLFRTWLEHFNEMMRTEERHDAGIIKSFKSQLNKIRDEYVVDKLDAILEQVDGVEEEDIGTRVEQLYNVSILAAMQWAQQAWDTVTKATVVNCWRRTGILATDIYELVSGMDKLCIAPEPAN